MKTILLRVVMLLACAGSGRLFATDHRELIEGPFKTGPEVTQACLECHEKSAKEVMGTSHWTWQAHQKVLGREVDLGKRNAINNFCIAVPGNEPRCTSCHVGYGWKDSTFDFKDQSRVDCLVCHDSTGTYVKTPTGAGLPDPAVNLLEVARSVGRPTRANCGACHFQGGGGDAVKHGDLDSSLAMPSAHIDVHMAKEGLNFSCQSCHKTKEHQIAGSSLVVSPSGANHLNCESCHQAAPHKESRLNTHVTRIACQTCHVPEVAKEVPTKMYWDWSKAGQDLEVIPHDENGKALYAKMKGEFRFAKHLRPSYAWYNQTAGVYLAGDTMDPEGVTRLSFPQGSRSDIEAKIYPFKIHEGVQPYDEVNRIFIVPKLFGPEGYWKHYDWNKAAVLGMKAAGLPFSGKLGWAKTSMYWRINHMVAPKEEALGCLDCHGDKGRLDWRTLGYEKDPLDL